MAGPIGFSRDFSGREAPCIGVFGAAGSGKTRLCASAGEWAKANGTTPGWLVCDRKTRKTVRDTCLELSLPLPFINAEDFVTQREAMDVAVLDRDKDDQKIMEIYAKVYGRFLKAAVELAGAPKIDPVIIETGTQLWDYISYAHFGRKQGVGKSRVWGPVKQDWTDLFDALSRKTTLITFWERDEYKGDNRTGFTKPDGPPHLGYTATTLVRVTYDRDRRLKDNETYVDRFGLDVVESQDNVGYAGANDVLTGAAINYETLMMLLQPGE
jgi:hypothetical protein